MDFVTHLGFSSHTIHSIVMTCIFGVQLATLYLAMHKYSETRNTSWLFLILFGSVSSMYFFLHALVVPGFLIFSEELFDVFEHYGLFLGGGVLLIGSFFSAQTKERLYRLRTRILTGWVIGNLFFVTALIVWPRLLEIMYSFVDYATGVSGIFLFIASLFFFRRCFASREPLDAAVAGGLLILVASTILPFLYEDWNILWWFNHTLFLLGNIVILTGFIVDKRKIECNMDISERVPWYRKVKFKLVILILTLTTIPLFLLGMYGSFVAEQSLRKQVARDLEHLATANSAHIGSFINVLEVTAANFSSDGLIRRLSEDIGLDTEEAGASVILNQHLIRNKMPANQYLVGINILDNQGKIISSTHDAEIGKDESEDEYFREGLRLPYGQTLIVDYGFSSHFGANEPLIVIVTPLFDLNGSRAIGVIVTYFRLDVVVLLLNNDARHEETLDVYLVNAGSLLISQSRFLEQDAILSQVVDTEPVRSCQGGQNASGTWNNWRGEKVYGASVCLVEFSSHWTLVTEIDEAEIIRPANAFRDLIVIATMLLTVIIVFVTLVSVSGTVGFLEKLSRLAKKINQGDLDDQVETDRVDEVGMLAKNLDLMRQTIKAREDNLEETNAGLLTADQKLKANIADLENSRKATMNLFEDVKESEEQLRRQTDELALANLRIQEEKERAESILRFLKSIGEGIFATDIAGKIIFMNETAEVLSQKTFQEANLQPANKIFCFAKESEASCAELTFVTKALEKKKTITLPDHTVLIYDGQKKIPVSGTCAPIRDEHNDIAGTITVFQDVTKKHELDQMKDSFLSVAAHQLRTPLGSMRWSMELLLGDDLGKLPKEAREAVQQLYDNSQRMVTLVNDLLDISRIEQNRGTEEKTLVDIAEIVQAVLSQLQSEADKRHIGISVDIPKESLPNILVSPKHIHEALENLLSNAIKYNRNNGTVTIKIVKKEKFLELTIKDTGIGIPKDDHGKIFSKFFRATNAVLKETEGSGLGLSVVKSYLEENHAQVSFESEENVGTTFLVEFPLDPTAGIS